MFRHKRIHHWVAANETCYTTRSSNLIFLAPGFLKVHTESWRSYLREDRKRHSLPLKNVTVVNRLKTVCGPRCGHRASFHCTLRNLESCALWPIRFRPVPAPAQQRIPWFTVVNFANFCSCCFHRRCRVFENFMAPCDDHSPRSWNVT